MNKLIRITTVLILISLIFVGCADSKGKSEEEIASSTSVSVYVDKATGVNYFIFWRQTGYGLSIDVEPRLDDKGNIYKESKNE